MIVYTDRRRIPFQIDREDWPAVRRYSWSSGRYPVTNIGKSPHMRLVRLHTFLMGKAPPGLEWDHVNRDGMDNRRRNLRAVTHAENARNRRPGGVYRDRRRGGWVAYLPLGSRRAGAKWLGHFRTRRAAATARRAAEIASPLWRRLKNEGGP